jgi:hypothetical protein
MCSAAATWRAAVSNTVTQRETGADKSAVGPPFHPEKQRPKAPCPVCIKEKGDSERRELYSIRGFKEDQYDPQIPPSWFNAPPIRLDGNGKEMEALRVSHLTPHVPAVC